MEYIFKLMFSALKQEEVKDLLKWAKFQGNEEMAEALIDLDKPCPISDKE